MTEIAGIGTDGKLLFLYELMPVCVPQMQVIPLPFITIVFWWMCQGLFKKPLEILSLRGAADLDRKDEVSTWPQNLEVL